MRDLFVVLSGVFQVACMIPYVAGILRGKSKPIIASWFIWATLDAIAMLTSLSAIAIGTVPTLVSAWQDPSRESWLAWTIGTAASVCSVLAITEWSLSVAAQPIVFLAINGAVTSVLYVRPRFISQRSA